MDVRLQRVIQKFSAEQKGDQWIGVCPLCGHHSLSISNGDKQSVVAHCFKECNQDAITKVVLDCANSGEAITKVFTAPKKSRRRSHTEEELYAKLETAERALATDRQALAFLDSRGISLEIAKEYRLGVADFPGSGRCLVIPYFDDWSRSTVLQLRYRQLVVPKKADGTEDKSQKWKCDKVTTGVRRLFNLALLRGRSENDLAPVVVTESELDAMMLASLGIAAVSVDSAGHKLTEEDRTLLLGVRNLFLAFDQDEDGFNCTNRFMVGLPGSRQIAGYGEAAKDLGDLRRIHRSQGKDFKAELQKLFDTAQAERERKPELTDDGNQQRFVRRNINIVRFCKQRDKDGWFVWNGQRWRPDALGMAMELARQTAMEIMVEAGKEFSEGKLNKEEYEAKMAWWKYSSSHRGLSNMLAQAGKGTIICIEGDAFDSRPELLNLQNGTYNLETGEFYRARKEDLLTQVARVNYEEGADCRLWLLFLDGVTQGNQEVIAYLQRVFGYLLTGSQREQCFFHICGPGGTGKSVYWKTVRGLMGDYFAMVSPGTFVKKGRFNKPGGSGPRPELVALVGKRVAATVEMDEGDRYDAGLIKQITGGDAMTMRQLYAPVFTYALQCKPVFLTNFMPGTDDFSGGMEQRIRIVKFERVFRGTDDEVKDLDKLLEPEYPGILNWALAGLHEWQESDGLRDPQEVKEAVKEYITDENAVARWIKEHCTVTETGRTPIDAAFEAFKAWADANEELCKSARWFGNRVVQLGYKSEPVHGVRYYKGFDLAESEEPRHLGTQR